MTAKKRIILKKRVSARKPALAKKQAHQKPAKAVSQGGQGTGTPKTTQRSNKKAVVSKKKTAKKRVTKRKAVKKKAAPRQPNKQQQLFISEYLKDLNATQAAIRAKYSKKNADVIGYQLLQYPSVAAAIQKKFDRRIERTDVDSDYVLKKAVQYLETGLGDFLTIPADGSTPYFDLRKATPEQLECLDSLQIDVVQERDGVDEEGKAQYVDVRKIKLTIPKRKEMLDLVGRHTKVKAFDTTVKLDVQNSGMDKLMAEIAAGAAGLPSDKK